MKYKLSHPTKILKGSITLTASKSESNRALIIQALCDVPFKINNIAAAEDTATMQHILQNQKKSLSIDDAQPITFDVGAAGTTMRFLTAYLSSQPGSYILTGSERMKNRPIGILVDALKELGAKIIYIEKEGFPPLQINGKQLLGGEIEMDGSISSQYITALLLIAPILQKGLVIKFKGKVTSVPYVTMSLKMLNWFGVTTSWINQGEKNDSKIIISPQKYIPQNSVYTIEGDWSSASYWYGLASMAKEANVKINGLNNVSLQGDSVIKNIAENFNVNSKFENNSVILSKFENNQTKNEFDFSDCPDLAQTVAVMVAAISKNKTRFNGLHTLKIKETDRTLALKNELKKFNINLEIVSDDEIIITPSLLDYSNQPIATYEDHRMAMSFAMLAMSSSINQIIIEHPEVVKKSYPNFWNDLKSVGFEISEID